MSFKLNSKSVLSIGVTILGVASTVLSAKVDKDNRDTMKMELKKEILDDLKKN